MQALLQLIKPLTYLLITRKAKVFVDVIVPVFLAALVVLAKAAVPGSFQVLGKGGFLESINAALPNLTGFYIAALAAVASFNSVSMDQPVADGMHLPGEQKTIVRRHFLSYLFGYLAFLAFTLLLGGIFAPLMLALIAAAVKNASVYVVITDVLLLLYTAGIFAMFCTTLLGLYYLVSRAHVPDPQAAQTEGAGRPISISDARTREKKKTKAS